MRFRPQAWRYRDYVVRAFNTDKPYDRFLTEQLAGDELDPDDPELRVATGYLRLGTYEYNQRNVRGQWADILNDITDVTGEVFLGLSIGCARCHDHKFDPILQKDYYRLQAFFTPLLPRDDLTVARPRASAPNIRRNTPPGRKRPPTSFARSRPSNSPIATRGPPAQSPSFLTRSRRSSPSPTKDRSLLERQLGALAFRQITYEHDQVPSLLKGAVKARWNELQEALKRYDVVRPVAPDPVMTATDLGPVSPPTFIPGDRKQQPIEPGYLSVLDPAASPYHTVARGSAIHRAAADPGSLAQPARQSALDPRDCQPRLAIPFRPGTGGNIERFRPDGRSLPAIPSYSTGWRPNLSQTAGDSKPLHRLILTSATYRQAAQRSRERPGRGQRIDPENRLLWKRTVQRLDAEEIRDAMLAVSGELDPAIGGPSVPTSRPRRTIDTRDRFATSAMRFWKHLMLPTAPSRHPAATQPRRPRRLCS